MEEYVAADGTIDSESEQIGVYNDTDGRMILYHPAYSSLIVNDSPSPIRPTLMKNPFEGLGNPLNEENLSRTSASKRIIDAYRELLRKRSNLKPPPPPPPSTLPLPHPPLLLVEDLKPTYPEEVTVTKTHVSKVTVYPVTHVAVLKPKPDYPVSATNYPITATDYPFTGTEDVKLPINAFLKPKPDYPFTGTDYPFTGTEDVEIPISAFLKPKPDYPFTGNGALKPEPDYPFTGNGALKPKPDYPFTGNGVSKPIPDYPFTGTEDVEIPNYAGPVITHVTPSIVYVTSTKIITHTLTKHLPIYVTYTTTSAIPTYVTTTLTKHISKYVAYTTYPTNGYTPTVTETYEPPITTTTYLTSYVDPIEEHLYTSTSYTYVFPSSTTTDLPYTYTSLSHTYLPNSISHHEETKEKISNLLRNNPSLKRITDVYLQNQIRTLNFLTVGKSNNANRHISPGNNNLPIKDLIVATPGSDTPRIVPINAFQ